MQVESLGSLGRRSDRPHAFGGRVRRVVQAGRVLHRQHDRLGSHTRFGGQMVRLQQGLHRRLIVIQESVGGLGLGAAGTRLCHIGGRACVKIPRQRQQARPQPRIGQRAAAKLLLCPVGGGE